MIKKFSLFFAIILSSFLFLEVFSRILFKKEFENYDKRIMLFSENKTFKNEKEFFLYKPNTNFQSLAIYQDKVTNKLVREYSYDVFINNAGLVQLKNIDPKKDSIFILGASETKGQGSIPWFYNIEKNYINNEVQLINIGMIGTGPAQQKLLFEYIKEKYDLKVKQIIVIFSSGYFSRGIWNFNKQQLKCLKKNKNCLGTEGIYGFDFKEQKPEKFAQKVVNVRKGNLNSLKLSLKEKNYLQFIKEIAKKSYFIKKFYLVIKIYRSKNLSNENNYEALNKLNKNYPGKLKYIHMQSKSESKNNILSSHGKIIEEWFRQKKIIKNYRYCKIPYKGFHFNDSHANKIGYTFLKKCVEDAIDE